MNKLMLLLKSKKCVTSISVVLMASLVLGMGAMTFARYMSTFEFNDQTATAAKWGYVVKADVNNLFGSDYTKATDAAYATVTTDGAGVAVKAASAASNILAPGTSGYAVISVDGSAEVLAQLKVSIDITSKLGYDNADNAKDYFPIKWALTQSATAPAKGDAAWKTAEEVEAASVTSDPIAPGTDVETKYYLYWCWDFETGANTDEQAANNVHDTIIGAKSNSSTLADVKEVTGIAALTQEELDMYSNSMTFSLTAIIEQIQ